MILWHLPQSHIRPGGPLAVYRFVLVCGCVSLCLCLYLCLWSYDICQTVTHIRPGGPLAVFGRVAVMQIYSAHLEHSIQNLLHGENLLWKCHTNLLWKCHTNLLWKCHTNLLWRCHTNLLHGETDVSSVEILCQLAVSIQAHLLISRSLFRLTLAVMQIYSSQQMFVLEMHIFSTFIFSPATQAYLF